MAVAISSPTYSVVIAGKPGIYRTGMELVLNGEPDFELVGTTDTGGDAARLARMRHPSALIIDLSEIAEVDDFGGILDDIRVAAPDTGVAAIVGSCDPIVARDVLRAGALACITRDARAETLVDAVHRVVEHGTYIESSVAVALAQVATRNGDGDLTTREYEILRLLAMGHTNREVAERLYLSVRTIESHRARLQMKLGIERRSDLVRAARDHGLLG